MTEIASKLRERYTNTHMCNSITQNLMMQIASTPRERDKYPYVQIQSLNLDDANCKQTKGERHKYPHMCKFNYSKLDDTKLQAKLI